MFLGYGVVIMDLTMKMINKRYYFIEKNTKLPKKECRYKDCKYCEDLKKCEVWNKK